MQRPSLSTTFLLVLLVLSASGMLFFRYFITVDGPLHVLRASLIEAPWPTALHEAQGVTYEQGSVPDGPGARILMVLLAFVPPETAHDLFAALVGSAVVMAVAAFVRAHGTPLGLAILWLAPLSFSVLVIMGLFHFLLGVAVAFASMAWWKWRMNAPLARWSGVLLGTVLAWFTHRSAPTILGILFLTSFLTERYATGNAPAPLVRRSWMRGFSVLVVLVVVAGSFKVVPVVQMISRQMPMALPAMNEALLLRPFFVLDATSDHWAVRVIGMLLLCSLLAAAWSRCQMGRRLFWHDAFIALGPLFMMMAWIYDTPAGQRLLIAERSQWLAILFLVIWLVAIAAAYRGWMAHVIGGAAVLAMPLCAVRLARAEAYLARLEPLHDKAIAACSALDPGRLVLPVLVNPDKAHQHLLAYCAIRYDGILLVPNERVGLRLPPSLQDRAQLIRLARDPDWLLRHWRKGIPPEVDQVLIIGNNIQEVMQKHPWPTLLVKHLRVDRNTADAWIFTSVGK